jgi:CBS domain-containing protein
MFDGAVIERGAHLAAAAYTMRHARTPELIVVDDEASRTPVGIITAYDIVRAVAHAGNPAEETVVHWQSPTPTSVRPETPLLDALDLMLEQTRPQLPVVDVDHELVGVVDLFHIGRALRGLLGGQESSHE